MEEHEILLLPPFSDTNREGVRKKLWRNTIEIMASDDEDSDVDEDFALRQTGVFPAKRHCTQLSEVNETRTDTEQGMSINMETAANSLKNIDYEEVIYQMQIEEKLKSWQAFQEKEGSMDNNVNEILDYYRKMHPLVSEDEVSVDQLARFHFRFKENDMEDTAVAMAIRNHGLVQSTKLALQGRYCKCRRKLMHSAIPSECTYEGELSCGPVISNVETRRRNAFDADKVYECDQPEDFLERAVGVAIKKKGLSALSVDYG
ncbi:uncharacterized protein LOC105275256 [Ooceraea biroi]|uniref:Uncharacterized protein n=2 Tax=Ooceraea biroi TaxID=2015173 RepID=A0A026WWG4_OOCBI|nr:uncharacterized protein LOC105275256 [Ooceraea biroi]EZA59469.1 hypothetical protein X777_00312 [Ooceraea biroi]